MKEQFLTNLKENNGLIEFYPKDLLQFCMGCKNCFMNGEEKCPHTELVKPIWNAVLNADLLVFAYPVYALRASASIKSLLDHFCVHWMGVSKIYASGAGMMGDIFVDKMTEGHKQMLSNKMCKLVKRVSHIKPCKRMSLKEKVLLGLCKSVHKMGLKGELEPSLDNQYFNDKGWFKR